MDIPARLEIKKRKLSQQGELDIPIIKNKSS
jgi:hypothetical protein